MNNKVIYESENVVAKESSWEQEEIIIQSTYSSMSAVTLSYNEVEKLYYLVQLKKLESQ